MDLEKMYKIGYLIKKISANIYLYSFEMTRFIEIIKNAGHKIYLRKHRRILIKFELFGVQNGFFFKKA